MSLEPMLWALKDAPVADVEERAVLTLMAEAGHEDGCNSFLSQVTLAKRAMLADRTVRRRLDAMEARGLIARGDQSAASKIPADRRPVVYDLLIPHSWFPHIERINEYRRTQGRPPLTPEMRPDLPEPPPAKRRNDVGAIRSKDGDGDTDVASSRPAGLGVRPTNPDEPTGLQVRPDSEAATAGLVDTIDRTGSPTTHVVTHLINQEDPPPDLGDQLTTAHASVEPPPDASPPSGSSPEGGDKDQSPKFDEPTKALLAAAAAEVLGLKPGWLRADVVAAMLAEIDAGRPPAAVARAVVQLAADPETQGPGRLKAAGPWWNPPPPPPTVRVLDSGAPACPKHRGEPAGSCGRCRADKLAAADEVDRLDGDPVAKVPAKDRAAARRALMAAQIEAGKAKIEGAARRTQVVTGPRSPVHDELVASSVEDSLVKVSVLTG